MLFHIAADLSSQRLRSAAPSNQDPLGVENQFTYAVKPDLSLKNRESRRMAKPIIVIGAGICGVSTALWLRRSGHEVLLIDQNAPGTGASFGNAGLLAQWAIVPVTEPSLWRHIPRYLIDPMSPLFVKWRYLPKLAPWLAQFLPHAAADKSRAITEALIPLLSDAVDQHKALAKGTSAENWIADSAFSYAYRNRATFEGDAYGWTMKKTAGLIPEVITGPAVREHEPILGPAISCLAVLKGQGHILDPLGYITQLAAVFADMGGKLIQTKVQDFERSGDKIQAVLTDQGRFECDKIVVTAGIWSRALMGKLGLDVPLEAERGYHVIYKNPSQMPRNPMMMTTGKFGVTPMSDGLRCAGTVELGGIELGPSKAPIRLLRHRVAQAFPQLRYETTEEWMGFRPSTPDSLPLIGELGNSGIFTAFGHQHVGLTAGPKTGRLIADIIDQRSPNMDMRPYDPQRYKQ